MNYRLVYYDEARQDIKEARIWYRKIEQPLANRFSQAIKKTLLSLQRSPATHAVRYKNIRIANTDTFPYAIHYYIDDTEKYVVIVSIIHTSRNPDITKGRS